MAAVLQMLGEDGAIPVEIARLLSQLALLAARGDVADVLPELRQRVLRNGGHLCSYGAFHKPRRCV
jgi:hypothetical protein